MPFVFLGAKNHSPDDHGGKESPIYNPNSRIFSPVCSLKWHASLIHIPAVSEEHLNHLGIRFSWEKSFRYPPTKAVHCPYLRSGISIQQKVMKHQINKSLMQGFTGWVTSTGCQGVSDKDGMIYITEYGTTTLRQLMLDIVLNNCNACNVCKCMYIYVCKHEIYVGFIYSI